MEVEIGRGKKARRAYGFDDIAIVPSRRTRDPDDVDISWTLGPYRFDLPLLPPALAATATVPPPRPRAPDDVDISWTLGPYRFDLPLLASAMDGVVSPRTAIALGKLGGLPARNLGRS